MPFAGGHFDLIVSNLGLNNFEDRIGAVRECRRVAKNGAVLALTTNLQGHMQELYSIFEEVLTRRGLTSELASLREHVAHRATVAAVRELLESNGFQVTRVVERMGRMRFASGSALLHHYFIKLGFLDAWKKVVTGREGETFPELEEQLDRYAAGHDGLSLTIPMAYIEAQAR
jgi:SAM-dependent methyltransferase